MGSSLFFKNYIRHGKGTLTFSNGKEILSWDGNFILIVKQGTATVYDCFSNRPLCSVKKALDLSEGSCYKFKNRLENFKMVFETEYAGFDIVSELENRNSSKNAEFDIRDALCKTYVVDAGLNLISTEFEIDYGIIDVLAEKDGTFYVFEIKRDRGKVDIIGQLLRYAEYFHNNNRDFELIAVAESFKKEDIEIMKIVGIKPVRYDKGTFIEIF